MWYSKAICSDCEWNTDNHSSDLQGVVDKAREHKDQTGHSYVIDDVRK